MGPDSESVSGEVIYAPLYSNSPSITARPSAPLSVSARTVSANQLEKGTALMVARYARGERVCIKLHAMIWSGGRRRMVPGSTLRIDCDDAAQAQLALEAISRFVSSLDGLYLAPPPAEPPHSGPKTPGEG